MPTFVARIGTEDGAVGTKTFEAPDEGTAREQITRTGGRVFSIRAAEGRRRDLKAVGRTAVSPGSWRRARGPKLAEFLVFNQELVALLKAGLPVVSGFEILLERQQNPSFKRILTDIREQLVSGVALSDAFLSHGDIFPRLYATSLKAGERSGEVERVLRRYLSYQRLVGTVRRKVIAALVYPALLISLSVGLIVILMTYVIPKFTEFYAGFGSDLPLLTVVVTTSANFAKDHFAPGIVLVVLGVLTFARWRRSESGRRAWDGFLLKLPLIGGILHQFALSQFARSLATLVGAGTPLVPALESSSGSVANQRISEAVTAVVPKVREGAELWRSLENTGQFTSLTVEMIKVGEATGALEEMLTNVSDFYDESIDASLQKLITLIEPVILIVMGGVIATLLLSIYLPMFTILSNIKG
jgi:type IV pilus assembly protein PilC